jgi:plasmid segregation protein ParM
MTEILGLDIGFGYVKAMTPDKRALIPSLVGPAEAVRYESDVIEANGHGVTLEVDGRWYFVGEQAELQSASASQTLDATRTGSAEYKALFYAAASEVVKTTSDRVAVISGLPVSDYDDHNKDALTAVLTGEHEVKRQGKWARRFTVENVYIVPQAMGSLFALVLDRQGKLADGELAAGRVGLVDVGTLTTNFILVDRLRYVETGSDSITSGMAEPLTKIAKDLKREHGLDWSLHLGKVDQAARARTVEVFGEPVDISDLIEPHLSALADTVISKARSLWSSGVDLKAVVVTGGGSVELAPYIREAFPHTRTVGGDPQFANVIGYLRAGLRRFGPES